jgi:hypothetical protein
MDFIAASEHPNEMFIHLIRMIFLFAHLNAETRSGNELFESNQSAPETED